VIFGIYLCDDMLDNALLIDQEGGPAGAHILFAHELLKSPHLVVVHDLLIGVSHQREIQLELILEFLMAFFVIHAYAYDRDTAGGQRLCIISQVAGLCRTARRIVLGVKVKRYLLSLIIFQLYRVPVLETKHARIILYYRCAYLHRNV